MKGALIRPSDLGISPAHDQLRPFMGSVSNLMNTSNWGSVADLRKQMENVAGIVNVGATKVAETALILTEEVVYTYIQTNRHQRIVR